MKSNERFLIKTYIYISYLFAWTVPDYDEIETVDDLPDDYCKWLTVQCLSLLERFPRLTGWLFDFQFIMSADLWLTTECRF